MNFDDVLNATSGPTHENHNPNDININIPDFDARLAQRINAAKWDPCEMGMTIEQAIARIKAADTPEARERTIQEIRDAALRRANLDTSTGRIAVVTTLTPPWHGLGTQFDRRISAQEALQYAQQDYTVELRPAYAQNPDGSYTQIPNRMATVRTDTGQPFTTVSPKYTPLQNREAYEIMDTIAQDWGAHYESAGAVNDGARVWMLAKMPDHFEPITGDENYLYLLIWNTHDGTAAITISPTALRVECANTLNVATRTATRKYTRRHTRGITDTRTLARHATAAFQSARDAFAEYAEHATLWARTPANPSQFANALLDDVLDITETEARCGAEQLAINELLNHRSTTQPASEQIARTTTKWANRIHHRQSLLDDILDRAESHRCQPGTLWGAFNAATESIDHHNWNQRQTQTHNPRRTEEQHLIATTEGTLNDRKQTAYQLALNYSSR